MRKFITFWPATLLGTFVIPGIFALLVWLYLKPF